MKTILSIIKHVILIALIGCISAIYALFVLICIFYFLPFPSDPYSFAIAGAPFGAISFGLTSMFFWQRLIRLRQRLTVRRGVIVGLLSALTVHPVMFILSVLIGAIAGFPSYPTSTIDALGNMLHMALAVALIFALFEILLWWLILLTLALGALGGGIATALILGIQSRMPHVERPQYEIW